MSLSNWSHESCTVTLPHRVSNVSHMHVLYYTSQSRWSHVLCTVSLSNESIYDGLCM